jgi:FixJ family two-component response regulator
MYPVRTLIAVVEDETAAGFDVDTYPDGSEFLCSLRHRRPQCVVLDLHMPSLNGFEVQERLAAVGSPLPVVIVTGHDNDATRSRALAGGAAAYLRKPVDDQVLLDAIAVAIATASR